MAFDEDLSQFFDTRDFAVPATLHLAGGDVVISAIFNTPSQAVEIYDADIEAGSPNMTARKSDIAGLRRGDTVQVGGGTHTVVRIGDDGTGLSTVYFE